MTSNKGANYLFRLEVIEALRAAGFTDAHRPHEAHSAAAEAGPHGDVLGIPGVTLAVRNERTLGFAEAVDEAEREAKAQGHELFAVVAHRRGHADVLDSYAVTSLDVLIKFMHSVSA